MCACTYKHSVWYDKNISNHTDHSAKFVHGSTTWPYMYIFVETSKARVDLPTNAGNE